MRPAGRAEHSDSSGRSANKRKHDHHDQEAALSRSSLRLRHQRVKRERQPREMRGHSTSIASTRFSVNRRHGQGSHPNAGPAERPCLQPRRAVAGSPYSTRATLLPNMASSLAWAVGTSPITLTCRYPS